MEERRNDKIKQMVRGEGHSMQGGTNVGHDSSDFLKFMLIFKKELD